MTTAIITGAARGIGLAIASRLATVGHHPILVDLDPAVHESAQTMQATAVQADIATPTGRAEVLAAVRTTRAAHGGPGVLVNNAGVTRDAQLKNMTEENFRLVLRVNLGAAYALVGELENEMTDGGAIVNISSRAQLGNFGQFNYAISKGGVVGLTRGLALQLAPRLRVNAVAPGFIATTMTDAMPEPVRQQIIAKVPLGRAGEPDDIADTVAWLSSDQSSYITGQLVYCCGGRAYS